MLCNGHYLMIVRKHYHLVCHTVVAAPTCVQHEYGPIQSRVGLHNTTCRPVRAAALALQSLDGAHEPELACGRQFLVVGSLLKSLCTKTTKASNAGHCHSRMRRPLPTFSPQQTFLWFFKKRKQKVKRPKAIQKWQDKNERLFRRKVPHGWITSYLDSHRCCYTYPLI